MIDVRRGTILQITKESDLPYWEALFHYNKQSFEDWCVANQRCPLPATAETVRLYVFSHIRYVDRANLPDDVQEAINQLEVELATHGIARAKRPLKYATIEAYVSHISAAHQAAEAHNPGHDNPMRLAMKTVRRISAGSQTQRAPIRSGQIDAIKALDVSTLRDRQDVLITLTAREVGARIGAVLDRVFLQKRG